MMESKLPRRYRIFDFLDEGPREPFRWPKLPTFRTFLYRIGLAPQSELDRAMWAAGELIAEKIALQQELDYCLAVDESIARERDELEALVHRQSMEIAALKVENRNLARNVVERVQHTTDAPLNGSRVRILASGEAVRGV